ncbi:MAG: c-type cytochrome biogenesis protein CcmI [Gammaproteobacteria bacterium]|nr:c-type cytochrome biogenesis protein CcmI [Gammaproteobacteria bacterium]
MILTLAAIILLGVAVGGWIYLDTRYQQDAQRWSRRDANLAIHAERVAEAERDEAEQDKVEADHLLLNEVTDEEPETPVGPRSFILQIAGCVLVCVLGFLGYLVWGDLQASTLERFGQQLAELPNLEPDQQARQVKKLIAQLERRNNSRHRSAASSYYLISAYTLVDDLDGVIRTHKQAEANNMTSVDSDVFRIHAEEMVYGEVTADALRVAERVLATVPDHPSIMRLFGVMAYRDEEYIKARNFFERGIRNTQDPDLARQLEVYIDVTNEQLNEDHIGIRLNIDVQTVSAPGLWLTVFAQAAENDPPIAVVQRPFVRKTNYNIVLDDAVAMLPHVLLSDANRVRVIARLSPSQSVLSTDAIKEVSSGWLDPSTLPKVSLRLSNRATEDGISISVSLGTGIAAEDDATVFIIGRTVASKDGDPPLIVKRVRKRDLPLDVVLTVEDAMLPLEELPEEGLEVYARLSRTGNTTRANNDVESNRAQVQVGNSTRLILDEVVRETDLIDADSEAGM